MVIVYPDKIFTFPNGKQRLGYYMDGILKHNIDHYIIPAVTKNNFDSSIIVDGKEGVGKTNFTASLAYYVDPTFPKDCTRIVFSGDELLRVGESCSKFKAVMFDEAVLALASQDFSTDLQRKLIKFFQTVRKKNLFFFLVMPYFFMFRKYFVLRSRALMHCHLHKGYRGYFKCYNTEQAHKMYVDGIKYMDYGVASPSFIGRFTNTFGLFFDEDIYDAKKDLAIKSILGDETKTELKEMEETFRGYKQKLNESVQQWRTKQVERFQEKIRQKKDEMVKLKEVYDRKFNDQNSLIKVGMKSRDKKVIAEKEKQLLLLLAAYYGSMKDLMKRFKLVDKYTVDLFYKHLELNKVDVYTKGKLKKMLVDGMSLQKTIMLDIEDGGREGLRSKEKGLEFVSPSLIGEKPSLGTSQDDGLDGDTNTT